MNKFAVLALAAPSLLFATGMSQAADVYQAASPAYVEPAQPSGARDGVRIGYLDCGIAGGVGYVLGSAKSVECAFVDTVGGAPIDRYAGTIRKLGVDVGFTTGSRMIWAVVAPTAGYHQGSLGGLYNGATAEATLGAGVGANVLVGGTSGSVHLKTVSLTGQIGLNLAAAGTSMTLDSVN
jgi:hypothetical protein